MASITKPCGVKTLNQVQGDGKRWCPTSI